MAPLGCPGESSKFANSHLSPSNGPLRLLYYDIKKDPEVVSWLSVFLEARGTKANKLHIFKKIVHLFLDMCGLLSESPSKTLHCSRCWGESFFRGFGGRDEAFLRSSVGGRAPGSPKGVEHFVLIGFEFGLHSVLFNWVLIRF